MVAALAEHLAWMSANGTLQRRRVARAANEVEALVLAELRARMGDLREGSGVAQQAAAVVDRRTDPYSAADHVLAALG